MLALTMGLSGAYAAEIADFFGEYIGEATVDKLGEQSIRDLSVIIAPHKKAFNVRWAAVKRGSAEVERKEFNVNFRPSPRAHIYSSSMRSDLFGNPVALDPMSGDPYFWATLHGDTLSVYALLITEDGRYDMQVYHRTLVPGGMELEYSRLHEDEVTTAAKAFLRKVK
jgi:hypothetical protein